MQTGEIILFAKTRTYENYTVAYGPISPRTHVSPNCHTHRGGFSVKYEYMKHFGSTDSYFNDVEAGIVAELFNPYDFIEMKDDGFALCHNPMASGGLSAITVNTCLSGESLRNFEQSIKRMVLAKLFSPKFGEVILTACRISARD